MAGSRLCMCLWDVSCGGKVDGGRGRGELLSNTVAERKGVDAMCNEGVRG